MREEAPPRVDLCTKLEHGLGMATTTNFCVAVHMGIVWAGAFVKRHARGRGRGKAVGGGSRLVVPRDRRAVAR